MTMTMVAPSAAAPPSKPSRGRVGWLVWVPFVGAFVYSALLTYKPTRAFALLMQEENYPVEILTFLLLLAGGFYGLRMAIQAKRRRVLPMWMIGFYLMFAAFLLLTGFEEVSWGQWFFHFKTPESIARINTQQEFTLHNLEGLGGNTVWLRLAFGVGGMIGIALWWAPKFRPIAVPPILWAWFVVIIAFSTGDLVTDYVGIDSPVAALFEVMSEIVEVLIAGVGCLYLWFKAKELLGESATA